MRSKKHDSFALRNPVHIPLSARNIIEGEYPAYRRQCGGETRIELFRKDQRLQGPSVAEQKRTRVGMHLSLFVDESVFVGEMRCAAPEKFGYKRGLSRVCGARKEQRLSLDKHRACMHGAKHLHPMDHGIIERLDGGECGIVERDGRSCGLWLIRTQNPGQT